jgi:hypothetical protein
MNIYNMELDREEILMRIRSKKVLVFVALVLIGFVMIISPDFTGWVVDTLNITIGVASGTQGCISVRIDTPDGNGSFVIRENETLIRTYVENCGNTELNGTVNVRIFNYFGAGINESNSTPYSLNPLEIFNYNYTWNVTAPIGTYFIIVKDNYTSETAVSNTTFYVTACVPGSFRCNGDVLEFCNFDWEFHENCIYGCSNGACLPPPPPILGPFPPAPLTSMKVEVLRSIDIPQRSNKTFLIRVVNDGQATLHNITLKMKHENLTVETLPEDFPEIAPGYSALFLAEIGAYDIELGDYLVYWTVSATEDSESGYIIVTVKMSHEQEKCEESLRYYLDIMDKLKEQINEVESQGKNVSRARDLFDETMYELFAAQTFHEIGSYQKCVDRVTVAEANIREIVLELSRAKPIPVLVMITLLYQAVYWTAIALIITFVTLLVIRKLIGKIRHNRKHSRLMMPKTWRF